MDQTPMPVTAGGLQILRARAAWYWRSACVVRSRRGSGSKASDMNGRYRKKTEAQYPVFGPSVCPIGHSDSHASGTIVARRSVNP